MRLSTLPTAFGEKVVMRIFDPGTADKPFDALGFSPDEARRWAQIAKDNSVTIYTIGYGATQCCGGTCDVDSCLLKEVASGSDKYYYASSSTVIGEAFNAIGQRIGHRLLK